MHADRKLSQVVSTCCRTGLHSLSGGPRWATGSIRRNFCRNSNNFPLSFVLSQQVSRILSSLNPTALGSFDHLKLTGSLVHFWSLSYKLVETTHEFSSIQENAGRLEAWSLFWGFQRSLTSCHCFPCRTLMLVVLVAGRGLSGAILQVAYVYTPEVREHAPTQFGNKTGKKIV